MILQQVIADKHLFILTIEGEITYHDMEKQFLAMHSNSQFLSSMQGVVDLRKAILVASPEDMEKLGDLASSLKLTLGRWAYIADAPMPTALAMLYKDHIASLHESEIFSTVKSASTYLMIDLSLYLVD